MNDKVTNKTRSINVKTPLVKMMKERFPDFEFCGTQSPGLYGFTRKREYNIYDHVIFQRDFYDGIGKISNSNICCCFNPNWRIYPSFAMGKTTDTACLIAGCNYHNADIGWHTYQNREGICLEQALNELEDDVNRHILPWLDKTFRELSNKKMWKIIAQYWHECADTMSDDDKEEIKKWFSVLHGDLDSSPEIYMNMLDESCRILSEKNISYNINDLQSFMFHWIANYLNINQW